MLKSDFNGYEEFMKKIGEATKEAGSRISCSAFQRGNGVRGTPH